MPSKLEAIYDLHEDVRVSGNLVDLANAQFSSQHEIGKLHYCNPNCFDHSIN